MSKGFRQLVAGICLSSMATLCAMPALAAEQTAEFALTCGQKSVQTGKDSSWTLELTRTDLPLAGALLTFAVDGSARLTAVEPATDIEAGELSYSYQDGVLRVMYLDNQAGEDPLQEGKSVAILHFAFENDENPVPVQLSESDLCGIQNGELTDFNATASVSPVTLTGEPATVDVPEDFYSEGGQPARPVEELKAELAAETGAGEEPLAGSSEGQTPAAADRPMTDGATENSTMDDSAPQEPTAQGDAEATAEETRQLPAPLQSTLPAAVWIAAAGVLIILVLTVLVYRRRKNNK